MFDNLLRKLQNYIGNKFAAYADDLLVNIEGKFRREVGAKSQRVVDQILEWSKQVKLQISEHKTEEIFLKRKEIRKASIDRRGGGRADKKTNKEAGKHG